MAFTQFFNNDSSVSLNENFNLFVCPYSYSQQQLVCHWSHFLLSLGLSLTLVIHLLTVLISSEAFPKCSLSSCECFAAFSHSESKDFMRALCFFSVYPEEQLFWERIVVGKRDGNFCTPPGGGVSILYSRALKHVTCRLSEAQNIFFKF